MEETLYSIDKYISVDAGGKARTRIYGKETGIVNIVGAGSKPAQKENGFLKTGAELEERLRRRRLEQK